MIGEQIIFIGKAHRQVYAALEMGTFPLMPCLDHEDEVDWWLAGESIAQEPRDPVLHDTQYLITWRRHHKDPVKQAAEPWVPIKSPRRAWKTAMRAISAKYGRTYRWHDLRASFITHVALTSGSLAAQRLARHKDFETTQAYIEVANAVRREAANGAAARPAFSRSRKQESQTGFGASVDEPLKLLK